MAASITRTTTGLLERDEFGSDTSGNYNAQSGATMAVSGGTATCTANKYVVRKTLTPVKCVTASGLRHASGAGRISGPFLCVRGTAAPDADLDGYSFVGITTVNKWGLGKATNAASSSIGTDAATSYPGPGAYGVLRLWQDAATVYGRAGASALVDLDTATTETTYDCAYGGIRFINYAGNNLDWVEYRTGVTVVCSGIPTGGYCKVTDGTTTAKAAASAGTATVNASAVLFPLTYVYVYDGDPDAGGNLLASVAAATYADMGGGDVFTYDAGSVASTQTSPELTATGAIIAVPVVQAAYAVALVSGMLASSTLQYADVLVWNHVTAVSLCMLAAALCQYSDVWADTHAVVSTLPAATGIVVAPKIIVPKLAIAPAITATGAATIAPVVVATTGSTAYTAGLTNGMLAVGVVEVPAISTIDVVELGNDLFMAASASIGGAGVTTIDIVELGNSSFLEASVSLPIPQVSTFALTTIGSMLASSGLIVAPRVATSQNLIVVPITATAIVGTASAFSSAQTTAPAATATGAILAAPLLVTTQKLIVTTLSVSGATAPPSVSATSIVSSQVATTNFAIVTSPSVVTSQSLTSPVFTATNAIAIAPNASASTVIILTNGMLASSISTPSSAITTSQIVVPLAAAATSQLVVPITGTTTSTATISGVLAATNAIAVAPSLAQTSSILTISGAMLGSTSLVGATPKIDSTQISGVAIASAAFEIADYTSTVLAIANSLLATGSGLGYQAVGSALTSPSIFAASTELIASAVLSSSTIVASGFTATSATIATPSLAQTSSTEIVSSVLLAGVSLEGPVLYRSTEASSPSFLASSELQTPGIDTDFDTSITIPEFIATALSGIPSLIFSNTIVVSAISSGASFLSAIPRIAHQQIAIPETATAIVESPVVKSSTIVLSETLIATGLVLIEPLLSQTDSTTVLSNIMSATADSQIPSLNSSIEIFSAVLLAEAVLQTSDIDTDFDTYRISPALTATAVIENPSLFFSHTIIAPVLEAQVIFAKANLTIPITQIVLPIEVGAQFTATLAAGTALSISQSKLASASLESSTMSCSGNIGSTPLWAMTALIVPHSASESRSVAPILTAIVQWAETYVRFSSEPISPPTTAVSLLLDAIEEASSVSTTNPMAAVAEIIISANDTEAMISLAVSAEALALFIQNLLDSSSIVSPEPWRAFAELVEIDNLQDWLVESPGLAAFAEAIAPSVDIRFTLLIGEGTATSNLLAPTLQTTTQAVSPGFYAQAFEVWPTAIMPGTGVSVAALVQSMRSFSRR